ncbi:MAG: MoxR family ATPase [Pseudomonadota bacterium]
MPIHDRSLLDDVVETTDDVSEPAPQSGATPFVELGQRLTSLIIGKDRAVEHLLVALLCDGHVLLEGAPGLAKTRIARLLATAIQGTYKRMQFTPDLLPSDLIGASIYNASDHRFEFQPGPVFANFILADEINRAPAKVQSALLEAMEERQVTSGETTYPLDAPFFVIATQNPIEHEGTWDLPQAQLDRFAVQIIVDYPRAPDEREILDLALRESTAAPASDPLPVISKAELAAARANVAAVHLSDVVRDYIVRLIAATRGDPVPIDGVGEHLSHPISPRGTILLARAAQARAWLHQRDYVTPEDVVALAPDVLRHRIGLTYRAEADGVPPDRIVAKLLEVVDVV